MRTKSPNAICPQKRRRVSHSAASAHNSLVSSSVRSINGCDDDKVQGTDEQLSVKDNTDGSKEVHVLTVTFKPTKPGDLERKLKVITDLKDEGEVEFETTARVEK